MTMRSSMTVVTVVMIKRCIHFLQIVHPLLLLLRPFFIILLNLHLKLADLFFFDHFLNSFKIAVYYVPNI